MLTKCYRTECLLEKSGITVAPPPRYVSTAGSPAAAHGSSSTVGVLVTAHGPSSTAGAPVASA
jgi:hypothetical protein